MPALHLEDVCEEMFVADDIRNQEGLLLLKRGQKIEERHIRLLKIWGIYHLEVLSEEGMPDEASKEVPLHVLKQLDFFFQ